MQLGRFSFRPSQNLWYILIALGVLLASCQAPQARSAPGHSPADESAAGQGPVQSVDSNERRLEPTTRSSAIEETTMEINQAIEPKTVFNFDENGPKGQWVLVNDTVMGGVSQSGLVGTPDGTALFSGVLSLENNGGFASVRSMPKVTPLGEYSGIELLVRGDGSRYQLRLRTDGNLDGVAYRASFDTVAEEWLLVRLPFSDFVPTFRGRVPVNHPQLDADQIKSFGLMITDKQAGRFSLEMAWIRAYS